MLYTLLTRFFGDINLYDFLRFHFYLRKTGHVIGYGMLALLLLRAWRATLSHSRGWLGRVGILALVGTAIVASLDEWHQSFIPSRTGSISDVLLDTAAGLIFLAMALLWVRRSEPEDKQSEAAQT
jgi:VanZ family protein